MDFKVMDINGKSVGEADDFKSAVDLGFSFFAPDETFLVKEGTRKAEEIRPDVREIIPRLRAVMKIKLNGAFPENKRTT